MNPNLGESKGYTVVTKDGEISISDYPLTQTEFLFDSKLGKVFKHACDYHLTNCMFWRPV